MDSPEAPDFQYVDEQQASLANRADWDAYADEYQAEHGGFLRDVGFVWCPEGVDEADVHLLGDVRGRHILEVGCGAAQCSRWLRSRGAVAVGFDVSYRQLQHSHRIDEETGIAVPVVCATATALPFASDSVDMVCSAFGALPFVVDIEAAFVEIARVVRPGGQVVFSVVHPFRRMFPDDPTAAGLRASRSYFDRRAYVELDDSGVPTYVEPHHTLGDWVQAVISAGLTVERLIEPEWPSNQDRTWGGWGPERGRYLPGTAIFVARRPQT
jgi:SAM-dependent methyltransferase